MKIFWRLGPHNRGVECRWAMKKWRFLTNISLYLDMIQGRVRVTTERTPIRTRMRSIEWCRFQWPWMTFNPDCFKSKSLFDAKYLRNGTRWRHGILIGTYTHVLLNGVYFQMILYDLAIIRRRRASRCLSAIAELLAYSVVHCVILSTHCVLGFIW